MGRQNPPIRRLSDAVAWMPEEGLISEAAFSRCRTVSLIQRSAERLGGGVLHAAWASLIVR
jgi:hypothetical protein